jgi:hypothetical protein
MDCYEGATMIKTYRGMLASGGQDHIRLKTNRGDIGYRIVKFQTISYDPSSVDAEMVHKIYKLKQSSIDEKIDFTDGDLLGISYGAEGGNNNPPLNIIFDQEIFNQDIYITYFDDTGSAIPGNYYLELEQVTLNENQSTMATLQSLRRLALPRN